MRWLLIEKLDATTILERSYAVPRVFWMRSKLKDALVKYQKYMHIVWGDDGAIYTLLVKLFEAILNF